MVNGDSSDAADCSARASSDHTLSPSDDPAGDAVDATPGFVQATNTVVPAPHPAEEAVAAKGLRLCLTPNAPGLTPAARRLKEEHERSQRLVSPLERQSRQFMPKASALRTMSRLAGTRIPWADLQLASEILRTNRATLSFLQESSTVAAMDQVARGLVDASAVEVARAATEKSSLVQLLPDLRVTERSNQYLADLYSRAAGDRHLEGAARAMRELSSLTAYPRIVSAAQQLEVCSRLLSVPHLDDMIQNHGWLQEALVRFVCRADLDGVRDDPPNLFRRDWIQDGRLSAVLQPLAGGRGKGHGPVPPAGDGVPREDARENEVPEPASEAVDLTVLFQLAQLLGWRPEQIRQALAMAHITSARAALTPTRSVVVVESTNPQVTNEPKSRRVVIRNRGKAYEVSYDGHSVDLPRLKGWAILKILVENPDKEFGVMELWSSANGGIQGRPELPDEEAPELHARHGRVVSRPTDAEAIPVADEKAIAAYKRRLKELASEQEEAERFCDRATMQRLSEEREQLLANIPFAKGGKVGARVHSEQEERARKNVAKLINTALKAIQEEAPAIERHLRSRLIMGYRLRYTGIPSAE